MNQLKLIYLSTFLYLTGLYTGDVQLRSTRAIHTRQNPNGDRYGYECPEERDYYPYWHPTSWRDIAVMAHDKSFCENYYQKESFNVKTKCKFGICRGVLVMNLKLNSISVTRPFCN